MSEHKSRWIKAAVIVCRLIAGGIFVVSGWAKSVDPWGFVYKINDYLTAWDITAIPYEVVLLGSVALSASEFVIGLLLVLGCLRRSTPVIAALVMCFMLPLTVYLAIANPVSDCGCFGDFIVLSNTATMLKNVVLTLLVVFLIFYNRRVAPVITPYLQWLVIAFGAAYSLALAFVGHEIQPLADFRAYKTGTSLVATDEDSETDSPIFIYEKNGEVAEFSINDLPDSTWTFVERKIFALPSREGNRHIAVFDEDGIDVSDEVFTADGPLVILAVSEPSLDFLTRSRLANNIHSYVEKQGGSMIGLVAATGSTFDWWKDLTRPDFDVYSAEDTSLKELVRGGVGMVYIEDGIIKWKRNFEWISDGILDADAPDGNALHNFIDIDNGHLMAWLTGILIAVIALLWAIGHTFDSVADIRKKMMAAPVKSRRKKLNQSDDYDKEQQ